MMNVKPLATICLVALCAAAAAAGQATTEAARARWNKEYSGPLANLNRSANAVLVEAVKHRKVGRALDLGVGQGRNAIYLAASGWEVTGVDLSEIAVGEARKNAAASGVRLDLHVGDLDVYDFGKDRFDLIVSTYMHAWHDRSKTDIPARIYDALRPGGLLVMEAYAKPEVAHGFAIDELAHAFARFTIVRNEDAHAAADWDKDHTRHIVRFVAQKPPTTGPAANRPAISKITGTVQRARR